jgi:hypothetical protein
MAAKQAATKATKPARTAKKAGKAPAEDREHMMEFTFSAAAQKAIAAALKGLTTRQQERVLDAVDVVSSDVAAKVAKAIEKNVVANANELLGLLAPAFGKEGRWQDLRAILLFLEHLDVPVQQKRIAKAVERVGGADLVARYRTETAPR